MVLTSNFLLELAAIRPILYIANDRVKFRGSSYLQQTERYLAIVLLSFFTFILRVSLCLSIFSHLCPRFVHSLCLSVFVCLYPHVCHCLCQFAEYVGQIFPCVCYLQVLGFLTVFICVFFCFFLPLKLRVTSGCYGHEKITGKKNMLYHTITKMTRIKNRLGLSRLDALGFKGN